jgi:hypothetical protein
MTVLRMPSAGTNTVACALVADRTLVAKGIVLSEGTEVFNGQILCSNHHFFDWYGYLRISHGPSGRRSERAAGHRSNAHRYQHGERRDCNKDLLHNNPRQMDRRRPIGTALVKSDAVGVQCLDRNFCSRAAGVCRRVCVGDTSLSDLLVRRRDSDGIANAVCIPSAILKRETLARPEDLFVSQPSWGAVLWLPNAGRRSRAAISGLLQCDIRSLAL